MNDYADIADIYDSNGYLLSYGDGIVDFTDYAFLASQWLWDANDPNTWATNMAIPRGSEFYSQQREKFFAKYGAKRLEGKAVTGNAVDNKIVLGRKEREVA